MKINNITQAEINEFCNDNDLSGVFRNRIAGWTQPSAKLSLEIFLVTAVNNVEGVSCFDESVEATSGTHYEVVFNGKTYKRDFASEANELAKALLEMQKAKIAEIE